MPRLTGIIIGRDQGVTLDAAFVSIAECDQLIYGDCSSTDGSLDIADKYHAKIVPLKGNMSGSDQRNICAENAMHKNAFWISPDDVMQEGGVDKIRAGFYGGADAVAVLLREKSATQLCATIRGFNTRKKWIGRAHEYLEMDNYVQCGAEVVHHSGPWHFKPTDPDGTIKLLLRDIADMPKNPRWLYYLAREYFNRGDFATATMWFEKRVQSEGEIGELCDAFMYLCHCYCQLDRRNEATVCCMRALGFNANFKEAAWMMARLTDGGNSLQWDRMATSATNEGVLFVREIK